MTPRYKDMSLGFLLFLQELFFLSIARSKNGMEHEVEKYCNWRNRAR